MITMTVIFTSRKTNERTVQGCCLPWNDLVIQFCPVLLIVKKEWLRIDDEKIVSG